MIAGEVNLYAKYDRVAVKLVAKAGSTTVVTRGRDTTNYSDYYLSGFVGARLTLNLSTLEKSFVEVEGDGYITVVPVGSNRNLGTGALVHVWDNLDTSAPIETFYIVYYGDINGDGRVTTADATLITKEVASPDWSKRGQQVGYLMKAADLDGNSRIATADATRLTKSVAGTYVIDQQTGKANAK